MDCIGRLYRIQIGDGNAYKICVVDSDSNNLMHYVEVAQRFPEVEIHLVKNRNYEYGAWKYISNRHSNYDVYFCIQDSNLIEKRIDLSVVNDSTAYTFHHESGYHIHMSIKQKGIDNLKKSTLDYEPLIDTQFLLTQHCAFIVNRKTLRDIFISLPEPPVDKDGSCFYERNFGLYFIIKGITTLNLHDSMIKINGGRN
jgi:hypothetical protein